MDTEEFTEQYSPRFGDVIFSKEPTKSSRAICVAQAVSEGARGKRIAGNYSHAAFVMDCNNVVQSIGSAGVHSIFLYDFFKQDMEYEVLRPPRVPEVNPLNATYYVGQKYDSKKDFLRRFISSYYPNDTQVCSSLVAQTLLNFGIAEILNPESTSPIKLYSILANLDWCDVTDKYAYLLSLHKTDDDTSKFLRQNHKLLDQNLRSMQQSKKELSAFKDLIVSWNTLQTKWAVDLKDEELLKHLEAELRELEQIEEIEFAFHNTDEKSSHLFRK